MSHVPKDHDRLSVALLGYGLAGRIFHAPLITANADLALDAIVTSDPMRAGQARADHPGVAVVEHSESLWDLGRAIDVVVVASANVAHVPQSRDALAHGSHVVVDKPVAGTAADAAALADAARTAGRQLHIFQNRRWDSDFLTLQQLMSHVGPVHRLESRFERWRPDLRGVWRESADPAHAGGQLLDLGAHLVDQALHLLGPARAVSAQVRSLRDPTAADDDAVVTIHHTSGAVSLLFASAVTAVPGPRFRLLGANGGILIEQGDSQEDALRRGEDPGRPDWGREPRDHTARLVNRDGTTTQVPLQPGAWPEFYRRVVAAIRDDAPPPVPMDEVIAAMTVLDAARLSDGRLIEL